MSLFVAVSPRLRLLVLTLLVFNVGFYMVLPFLAVHLTSDLKLAAGWVGAVIGLRMVSQQGLFVVGGAIADRFGARRTVLAGIALRVVSFAALGWATQPWAIVVAVVTLGVAGALFTPAVEALVARDAEASADLGGPTRTEVFALYSVCSQIGTLIGPAIGSILVVGGFRLSCLVASAVFAAAFALHWRLLPHHASTSATSRPEWREVLANRRFLLFAVGFAGYLAVYNQLYLALPLQLERSLGSDRWTGWLFTASALLVVVGQLRVTSWAERRLRTDQVFALGFGLLALGAGVPAVAVRSESGVLVLAAVCGFVLLLTLGQMLLLPVSRTVVARLAGERMLGTHYGLVSTAGGVAVLLSSTVVGRAFDTTAVAADPGLPWLVLVAFAALSGTVTALVVRRSLLPVTPTSV